METSAACRNTLKKDMNSTKKEIQNRHDQQALGNINKANHLVLSVSPKADEIRNRHCIHMFDSHSQNELDLYASKNINTTKDDKLAFEKMNAGIDEIVDVNKTKSMSQILSEAKDSPDKSNDLEKNISNRFESGSLVTTSETSVLQSESNFVIDTGESYKDLIVDVRSYRETHDVSTSGDDGSNEESDNEDRGSTLSFSSTSSSSISSNLTKKDKPIKKNKSKSCNIRTEGELGLEDLPPIEDLTITVPENDLQILGRISGIVAPLVVIESFKNCPALDFDSVLFLTDGKPLGHVFDVFGPVKQPMYTVRFNSADEIVKKEITTELFVYYAPSHKELTSYVFAEDLLKQKGSDASWRHNNEPPVECLDYSDDEAERQARNKRKAKNRKPFSDDADEKPQKLMQPNSGLSVGNIRHPCTSGNAFQFSRFANSATPFGVALPQNTLMRSSYPHQFQRDAGSVKPMSLSTTGSLNFGNISNNGVFRFQGASRPSVTPPSRHYFNTNPVGSGFNLQLNASPFNATSINNRPFQFQGAPNFPRFPQMQMNPVQAPIFKPVPPTSPALQPNCFFRQPNNANSCVSFTPPAQNNNQNLQVYPSASVRPQFNPSVPPPPLRFSQPPYSSAGITQARSPFPQVFTSQAASTSYPNSSHTNVTTNSTYQCQGNSRFPVGHSQSQSFNYQANNTLLSSQINTFPYKNT